tara:strand:+ start:313 stop:618 length:306 start_codon:yes stop_codon:yes gene_type:complete
MGGSNTERLGSYLVLVFEPSGREPDEAAESMTQALTLGELDDAGANRSIGLDDIALDSAPVEGLDQLCDALLTLGGVCGLSEIFMDSESELTLQNSAGSFS